MAELGFVADGPNSYQIWLGGSAGGDRLAEAFAQRIKVGGLCWKTCLCLLLWKIWCCGSGMGVLGLYFQREGHRSGLDLVVEQLGLRGSCMWPCLSRGRGVGRRKGLPEANKDLFGLACWFGMLVRGKAWVSV